MCRGCTGTTSTEDEFDISRQLADLDSVALQLEWERQRIRRESVSSAATSSDATSGDAGSLHLTLGASATCTTARRSSREEQNQNGVLGQRAAHQQEQASTQDGDGDGVSSMAARPPVAAGIHRSRPKLEP